MPRSDLSAAGHARSPLRAAALPIYLPALLYGLGQGAIAPIVALTARDLGASVPAAALVVAAAGVGQILADVPAGMITHRFGEQRAMFGATVLVTLALIGCLTAPGVVPLALAVGLIGAAGSVFNLARQAYLTENVPFALRARALSTLGGVLRIGTFVGPFLTAALIGRLGSSSGYLIHLVLAVLAAGLLLVVPELEGTSGHGRRDRRPRGELRGRPGRGEPRGRPAPPSRVTTGALLRRYAWVFATLGTATMLVGAVRATRQVVLPLWAQHIGLDPRTSTLVFGLSGLVDTALFYPAGSWMDRHGRVVVAVPSMLVLGACLLLLPLTAAALPFAAVAVLMGVGNGLGAGIVMTLAADHAPADARSTFLGIWRLFPDAGNALGPLVLWAAGTVLGLAPAIALMGVIGLVSAGTLYAWTPRRPPADSSTHGPTPPGGPGSGGPAQPAEEAETRPRSA